MSDTPDLKTEKIRLSAEDWRVLLEALRRPPEPNDKLKEAARRFRERFGQQDLSEQ